jgi:hypothetical protein
VTLLFVPSGKLRIECSFSVKAQLGRRGADVTRESSSKTEDTNRRREGREGRFGSKVGNISIISFKLPTFATRRLLGLCPLVPFFFGALSFLLV